jgi:hypothetical protein
MKNTQRGFIGIIAIVIIVLIVMGGGAYVYTSHTAEVDITDPNEQATLKKVSKYAELCGSDMECLKAAENQHRAFTVYFKDGAREVDIISLKTQLERNNEFEVINYTSAAQGLADFKERHKDDLLVIETLGTVEGNPVSAKFEIKIRDYKKRDAMIGYIKSVDTAVIVDRII